MEDILKRYAELVVKVGVNLQKGQELVISANTDSAFFAREVVKAGYEAGAKSVTVFWSDEITGKYKLMYEDISTLKEIPKWMIDSREEIVDKKAAYIAIISEDPEIYKDVPVEKLGEFTKSRRKALEKFYKASMNNDIRWSIVAIPNPAWAKIISPHLSEEEGIKYLWSLIFKAMRLDRKDSVGAWREHQKRLNSICTWLNEKKFEKLVYKNSIGTDFSISLPKGYYFTGGYEVANDGIDFTANMPTEEVFTAPNKWTANGKLVASMPLFYNGKRIEDFYFIFKDGKVIEFDAKVGKAVLKELLDTDEGVKYLGEVALVEYDSPIQNLNTLFYNTLFDENASCHFALGKAYPCIVDSENMSKEKLISLGLNDSLEHVDFMIGTKDLNIIGIDEKGEKISIMKEGNFSI